MFQHQTRPVKANASFNYSKREKAVPGASRNSEPKITLIFISNYLVLYVLQPIKDHGNVKKFRFMFIQFTARTTQTKSCTQLSRSQSCLILQSSMFLKLSSEIDCSDLIVIVF